MGQVRRGEVDTDVQGRDPDALGIEDAYVRRMCVGISRLVGRDDVEAPPDRLQLSESAAEIGHLFRAALAEKADDARARVDLGVDAERERGRLRAHVRGQKPEGAPDLAGNDRALMCAVAVQEGDEDDSSAQPLAVDPLTVHDLAKRKSGQADAGRRLAAPIRAWPRQRGRLPRTTDLEGGEQRARDDRAKESEDTEGKKLAPRHRADAFSMFASSSSLEISPTE